MRPALRSTAVRVILGLTIMAGPACDNAIVNPAGDSAELIVVVEGRSTASTSPDGARIRVTSSNGGILFDDAVTLAPAGNEVRFRLNVNLNSNSETADVSVRLLAGIHFLERGVATVTLEPSATTLANIADWYAGDDLAMGDRHACYLDATGQAYCWGAGPGLGIGAEGTSLPVAVPGGHRFVSIAAGGNHTCAITDDGTAWCWGNGTNGELGDGATIDRTSPVPVSGGHVFTNISAGLQHSCGLTVSGEAMCWGGNSNGQLGNATAVGIAATPMPVATSLRFSDLRAGFVATCGVSDGEVWCWGFEYGGGTAQPGVPTRVQGPLERLVAVTAGATIGCVLTDAGAAYCWGGGRTNEYNYGQLGRGSRLASLTPVPVAGAQAFRSVTVPIANSSLAAHTCAIASDDTAWCWGLNRYFELGSKDVTSTCPSLLGSSPPNTRFGCSLAPVRVSGGERFSTIAVGRSATCALALSGRPWCWGRGVGGLLGQADLEPRSVPTPIGPAGAVPVPTSIRLVLETTSVAVGDTLIGYALTFDQNGVPLPAPLPGITVSDETIAVRGVMPDLPTTPPGGFLIIGQSPGSVTVSATAAGMTSDIVTVVVH